MGRRNQPHDVFKHIDMTATEIRPNVSTPCWPWKGALAGNGRPYFTVDGKKVLAYRLTHELVTGVPIPPDKVARHKCDNDICCRWDHVEPGTHDENMQDMKERERHGLPHHTIRAIRALGRSGRPHNEIAELYGIGRSTVTEIIGRVSYGEVSDDKQLDSNNEATEEGKE